MYALKDIAKKYRYKDSMISLLKLSNIKRFKIIYMKFIKLFYYRKPEANINFGRFRICVIHVLL